MGNLLRQIWAAIGIVALCLHSQVACAIETQQALDGTAYTVISPIYDGGTGSLSFIRLFNGGTATTTFNVTVVNAANGLTLGAAPIQVPAKASPQYSLTPAGGTPSIFSLAGVSVSSGAKYALYIQDSDPLAGYQHVVYNGGTQLFQNSSVCSTPISQQLAASNSQALTDLFTTQLAALAPLPTVITLHNYATTATVVSLTAYDSNTGSSVGHYNQTVSANSTVTMTQQQLEQSLGFSPTSSQFEINVVATNAVGGALPVRMTQSVLSTALGGNVDLSEICAMNAVAPTVVQAPATTPTAYCGTFNYPSSFPYPYYLISHSFTVSVAPNGRIRGAVYGIYSTYEDGGTVVGLLTGTSWIASSSGGLAGSGTIQNGTFSGTFSSSYGNFSVSGSTTACN